VRKVGSVPDLACGFSDGLGWLCFGIGLWLRVGIVLCGGRVSVGPWPCVGFGLWPQRLPGQTCALAKNKATNF